MTSANTHPANHGFLPHNGYATITEFIDATMSTVGMGVGLASFLAIYGAAIDGSGTAWSIGGTPFGVGAKGGNGITNSHVSNANPESMLSEGERRFELERDRSRIEFRAIWLTTCVQNKWGPIVAVLIREDELTVSPDTRVTSPPCVQICTNSATTTRSEHSSSNN